MTTLRDQLARTLHEAEDGPTCDCAAVHREIYTTMADAILPIIRTAISAALRDMADLIDRGPTFPLPPSVISALVRERADAIEAEELSR